MSFGHSLEPVSNLCRQTHADDNGARRFHENLSVYNVIVVDIVAFLEWWIQNRSGRQEWAERISPFDLLVCRLGIRKNHGFRSANSVIELIENTLMNSRRRVVIDIKALGTS